MTHLRDEHVKEEGGKVVVEGFDAHDHRVVEVYDKGKLVSRRVEGGPPAEDEHSRALRMKLAR